MRLLGRAAAAEAEGALAGRVGRLAAAHGDEVARAVARVGPRAVPLIESARAHGDIAARLLGRHGDRAAWVVGEPARLALIRINPARKIIM